MVATQTYLINILEDPKEIILVNDEDVETIEEKEEYKMEHGIRRVEILIKNYKGNYQVPQFIEYAFNVHNELSLGQREFYNKEKYLRTLGLDIVEVKKFVQVWELEYQEDDI